MDYSIRAATMDDVRRMAEIHQQSWQHAYRGIVADSYLDALQPDRWVAAFSGYYGPDGARLADAPHAFVMEVDNTVAGAATAGSDRDTDTPPGTGELYSVYLLPEYTGKGLGGALINHALTALQKMGFSRCVVWVLAENHVARAVYEHIGFAADGRTDIIEIEGQRLMEMHYSIVLGEDN